MMSEHVETKRMVAAAGDTGVYSLSGIFGRLLPANPDQRRMALWAILHGSGALIATALLWQTVPQHLLVPWAMFMCLTAMLYLLRGVARQLHAQAESQQGGVLTFMALSFGVAWASGAVAASLFLNLSQQLLMLLSLAPLAALSAPLLAGSRLAPRVYVLLLATPAAVVVAMAPDFGLFAGAFASAAIMVATLSVMSAANTFTRQFERQPGSGAQSDATASLRHSLAQQKQTLVAAEQERERARATLQSLNEAVITTDKGGRIDYLNPAAEVLTGWSATAALSRPAAEVIALTTPEGAVNPIEQALLTERTLIGDRDTTITRRDGSACEIDYTCAPVRDSAGRFNGLVVSIRDVSETRDMQARLSWAATHDALTGLINRREFEERLNKLHAAAVADGTSHALCFLDLDHFKTLNDTCGHLAGDDFLKGLAETLRGRIRGADTIARLGGDEFAVLLHSCPLDMAGRIAENLRGAVADYCANWKEQTPLLGASIGVVAITAESKNLTDVLATADLACYAAKSDGRNRVNVFRGNTEMLARWQGEVRWLQSIQTALEDNRFLLHWQPIEAATGDASARMCELSVHMRDADGAVHAPADFMPTAQRYHLMPAIDFWVVNRVVNALRSLHPTLSQMEFIGINLSIQSVTDERFEHELMEVLADPGIPASKLCFQLSEAAFTSHPARVRHLASRLRSRGCRLAVHECGVGVGSFNHLRRHEIDFLKIHDEFTRELASSTLDREVVMSLHRIVHCMGGKTIAERVADTAVLEQLRSLGIDYVQGYAVGRPEPLDVEDVPDLNAAGAA